MSQTHSPLVSPQWVAQQLGSPDLAILDASWHLPTSGRDPRVEFTQGHIPGAAFFDIDAISDPASGLPHMLPDARNFAKAMGALGVSENMTIVVYDSLGLFSAPRAWWSLQTFGAHNVYVLDGGLPAWRAAGLPIETGEAEPEPAIFTAQLNSGAVANIEDVALALKGQTAQVADARSPERFSGAAPEPRPGLPSGHMPGARNLPIGRLIAHGRLKPPPELLAAFHEAGLDPDAPLITSCGSGVTAAVINFALACAGKPAPRLYDGSWTQWASTPNAPIEPAPE